jgi:MFS transporter, OFA family, oxalate/formate antiporter
MNDKTAHWPFSPARFPLFYGWPVLAMGTLGVIMSIPGQTMGVSVFTDALLEALRLSRDQLSLAYMFGTLLSGALLPYAGRLYDRFGARVSAAVSCFFLAMVLLLLSRADILVAYIMLIPGAGTTVSAFIVILPAFFILRLFGQGVLTLSSHNMIAKWFDRRRGIACGVSGIFTALGFSSAPIVLDFAIRQLGWRGAWVAMAMVIGLGFIPLIVTFYRDNPEACGLVPDGGPPAHGNRTDPLAMQCEHALQYAWKTGTFWVFSLSFALSAFHTTGFTFHIVSIFDTAGMSRTEAVSIFLPASCVAVVVHLLCGYLSDRIALNRLLSFMIIGLGLSMTGMTFLAPGWPVILIITGYGISGGLFSLLSAVTWAKCFGRKHLGAISGVNLSIVVLHSAIGPVIFSQSYTWTGNYRMAAIFGLIAAFLLITGSFLIRPEAHRQSDGHTPIGS